MDSYELEAPTKTDKKQNLSKEGFPISMRSLIAVLLGSLLIIVFLIFLIFYVSFSGEENYANVKVGEVIVSGSILSKIDFSADPCEDFYQYSCGNYKDTVMIDLQQFVAADIIKDAANVQSIFPRLISKIAQDPESSCGVEVQLANYYYSCMDESYTRDADGKLHFQPQNTTNLQVEKMVNEIFRKDFSFELGVTEPVIRRPFQWFGQIAEFHQYFSTAKSVYFEALTTEEYIEILGPTETSVTSTLPIYWDGQIAEDSLDYLFELIAHNHPIDQLNWTIIKDVMKNNLEVFASILNGTGEGPTQISTENGTEEYDKWFDFLCSFEGLIGAGECEKNTTKTLYVDKNVLEQLEQNDCFSHATCFTQMQYISALHHALLITNYTYYGLFYETQPGIRGSIGREVDCINMFSDNMLLAEIITVAYMKKYLGNEMFSTIDRISQNILEASLDMLEGVENQYTRDSLQSYLKDIQFDTFEAYLDCNTLLDKFGLPQLKKESKEFVPHVKRWWVLEKLNQKMYMQKGSSLTGSMLLQTNAFFSGAKVQILPFFIGSVYDKFDPVPVKYGNLGFVIAHEYFHSMDPNVLREYYLDNDVISRIWDNATNDLYTNFEQCIVEEYNKNGLNGTISVGDNFADIMGSRVAFKAFTSYENVRKSSEEVKRIPGLHNFTPEQLFFISEAQTWCGASVNEAKTKFLHGSHAPGWARVNIVLSIEENFSKTFKCRANSKMTAGHHCKSWL